MTTRHKRFIAVLALLGVLLGGGLAADRIAVSHAERAIADAVQEHGKSSQRPVADIAGFPFLTQLAGHRVRHITVTSTDARHGGYTLTNLEISLDDITVGPDNTPLRAGHVEAQARVSWEQISTLAGRTIQPTDDGRRVRVLTSVTVAKKQIPVEVQLTPTLDPASHQLSFTDPQLKALGITVSQGLVTETIQKMAEPVQLPSYAGLQVSAVTPSREGVVVQVQGDDVDLTALR